MRDQRCDRVDLLPAVGPVVVLCGGRQPRGDGASLIAFLERGVLTTPRSQQLQCETRPVLGHGHGGQGVAVEIHCVKRAYVDGGGDVAG